MTINLDLVPLGWVHLFASLAAPRDFGCAATERHARSQAARTIYTPTLPATNVTALGIYRRGVFFFPHWLAIAALIVTTAGLVAAHFKIPRKAWLARAPDVSVDEPRHSGRRGCE